MAGCLTHSIFHAWDILGKWVSNGRVRYVRGAVRRLQDLGSWDRIFLAAGTLGSNEILMRTHDLAVGPVFQDNAIFQFPVLYTGGNPGIADRRKYFGMASLLLRCETGDPGQPDAQAQVYPNSDYLWRNVVPEALWSTIGPAMGRVRDRVIWIRAYIHGKDSYHYRPILNDQGVLSVQELQQPSREAFAPVYQSLCAALNRNGFHVLPIKPLLAKTSSHLAGGPGVGMDGKVDRNVYLCDGAAFPESPATSLTFSVMANARRTAWLALS